MKKILFFTLMMLPCAMSGQTQDDTWDREVMSNYESLPPAEKTLILEMLSCLRHDDNGYYWVFERDTIRNPEDVAMRIIGDNQVKEICNIPFGSSFEKAKSILAEKYGDYDYLSSTKDCLTYRNKSYGGILFTDMYYLFQSDGENSHFHKAVLCRDCDTMKDAVKLKQSLDEKFRKKYSIFKILDEEDIYISIGGLAPVQSENTGSYGFTLDVIEYEQRSKEGGARYAVRIMYGPYDYVRETF